MAFSLGYTVVAGMPHTASSAPAAVVAPVVVVVGIVQSPGYMWIPTGQWRWLLRGQGEPG